MTPNHKVLKKLESLITKHLHNENLSQEFICRELGISRSQLFRILKQENQPSLSHYVRQKRLSIALELVNSTELRISEIVEKVGFKSIQNFSKYFKDAFQLSPREYRNTKKQTTQNKAPINKSIAVLPFRNMSPDMDQEYFSDGLTEEIINHLVKVSDLKVAGRTSSFSLKNKDLSLKEIGNVLGVEYILEGSVRKANSKIRISTQLLEAASGYNVWTETYDFSEIDIFEIQDKIALAVLKEIKVKLLGENIEGKSVVKPEAYNHYLKGLYLFNKFSDTENFYLSIEQYKLALAIEPKYIECYVGMASSYIQLWFFSQVDASESIEKALEALHNALQINPNNTGVLIRQGHIKTWYEWDFKGALQIYKKATVLQPNSTDLLLFSASCNTILENYETAAELYQKALELDPLSGVIQFSQTWHYWWRGDFPKAEILADQLIAFKPKFWAGYYMKSVISLEKLHLKKALYNAKKAKELYPSSMLIGLLGNIYFYFGKREKALQVLKSLENMQAQNPVSNFDIAQLHILLGNYEKGATYLESAKDNHEGRMLFLHKAFRSNKEAKEHIKIKPFFKEMDSIMNTNNGA